jgi:hypothetical protein
MLYDVALFLERHLKSRMTFYIPKHDIYRSDCQDGHKDGTAVAVKKDVPHACPDLRLLL